MFYQQYFFLAIALYKAWLPSQHIAVTLLALSNLYLRSNPAIFAYNYFLSVARLDVPSRFFFLFHPYHIWGTCPANLILVDFISCTTSDSLKTIELMVKMPALLAVFSSQNPSENLPSKCFM